MRIAVLIENFFEEHEYLLSSKAFTDEGFDLVHVGLREGSMVKGKEGKALVTIDESVDAAHPSAFDALFIPGGYSPDRLRADNGAVAFVRSFVLSGKPVFVICHAPQLLISAGVLRGRKITGWKSIIQDIKNAGARYLDMEVVRDGNIISSRGPQDLKAFIKACIKQLEMEPHPVL